ncbi:MAG: AAA family ATPase [Deltaproteobacteria bacterium]
MQQVKVVIADDIQQTRENIRMLLELDRNIAVVGEAGNGQEVLDVVEVTNPDVVLMDINMPIMDGIKATEMLSMQHPDVGVIMISVQGEQEYLKKAMMAGAKEYMIKPFTADELSSAIKNVVELNKRRRDVQQKVERVEVKKHKPQIVAVYGAKGGVGKTSIAVNLAISLAHKTREKIALVDLDLQFGDIAVMVNVYPKRTIAELMQESSELETELMETYLYERNGIKILAAPNKPELAELVNEEGVIKILKALMVNYDYIVVDTSCNFNDVTLAVLDMADTVFLVTTPDLPALKNNKRALDILKSLSLNNKVRLVVNRSTGGFGIEIEDVERAMELPVCTSFPSDAKLVVASMNRGLPFVMVDANSPVSKSIRYMVGVASGVSDEADSPKKKLSAFGLLKGALVEGR